MGTAHERQEPRKRREETLNHGEESEKKRGGLPRLFGKGNTG